LVRNLSLNVKMKEVIVGMRRILTLETALTLFFVLVSTNIATAQAKSSLVFVGSSGVAPILVHPGKIAEFLDLRESPCGRADALILSMLMGDPPEEVPLTAVTDNEEFAGLLNEMFGGMVPVIVVEDSELEVWMKGRTMFAELTVPAGQLHPVSAEIKGCSGKPEKGMESETTPDYVMMMTYIGYEAVVSFVYDGTPCPPTVGMLAHQFLLKITPL